ncbi:PstS family phosphate ABC transporter substrate-binding protein [Orenia marismortui]|uniref:Phosphate-binding protein n=1 Tax=Orenia marismortui TaxID=46469 RepID=A0A4R8HA17_9FIRM|nr:PstS family phosphate ABC transporter substrate-binding protein [Orenia marismortui]TDX52659.1 phosphate ABC transporter substrate-binding protein (PhoT family) [Orenia marismortui]
MLRKKILLIVSLFAIITTLTACGQPQQGTEESQQGQNQAQGNKGYIQIKGSDTSVNLTQMWAEDYMENNDTSISVTGGGSGTGIAALINNKVDIANASRAMKDKEVKQAQDNGVEAVEIVVAMDGLSVIVNENNPIKDLTVDQIGSIFKGKITNWSEIGGPDKKINTYGRQSNSGTFVYFRDHVLNGDYTAEMNRMNGNAQLVEAVKADEGAIGYVGIGYVVKNGKVVEGLNVLNVAKDDNSEAASPLKAENVKTGNYPLARPLYQYTNGKPAGAILDFIKYELSENGQELAVKEGFYPVSPEYTEQNKRNLGE